MALNRRYDYVIVGGGNAGCVLASRLSHKGFSVIVLEAGPEHYNETIMQASEAPKVFTTPSLSKTIMTVPQPALENRLVRQLAGNRLSGSTTINVGNWTRTHSADWNELAAKAKDERWTYEQMLPYFRRVETHYDQSADPAVHGFDGPIHTMSGKRLPLYEHVRGAMTQAGVPFTADINDGNPLGMGPFVENWRDGKRQPSGVAYDLSKATVHTNSPVARVVIDESTSAAIGAQLISGEVVQATKEVLVCAGSMQTPKLLMLSGIGPAKELSSHGIKVIQDLPVGHNLHDHIASTIYFKLKHPEQGLAAGHPKFNRPEWLRGQPIDWITALSIPDMEQLAAKYGVPADDPRVSQQRAHTEIIITYFPLLAPVFFKDPAPLIGTHIAVTVLALLPRSCGTIRLKSADPADDPVINPNYLSEPFEWEAFRAGFRTALKALLETPAGQAFIGSETPPEDMAPLTSAPTDAQIDERVKKTASGMWQLAGSASLGSVLDSELRVKGVKGLRVVDASVFPMPLSGHYQYPVYAMAEAASDFIASQA